MFEKKIFFDFSASLLTSEEAVDYQHILDDSLKTDKLVESTALNTIQKRLDARKALGKSASEAQPIIFELGNIDVQKVLFIRSAARLETKEKKFRGNRSVSVTVGLGRQKRFEIPLEKTFSIGAHPTAVSLNDRYLETFFCRRTPGNSLILLSSTSIDIVNRGSGLESSVRLSKILGTTKDKILAGNWCESSQRLYLVGNHRMYIYDFQSDEHAKQYLCEPINGDSKNTQRFICSGQNGSIFYGESIGQIKIPFLFDTNYRTDTKPGCSILINTENYRSIVFPESIMIQESNVHRRKLNTER